MVFFGPSAPIGVVSSAKAILLVLVIAGSCYYVILLLLLMMTVNDGDGIDTEIDDGSCRDPDCSSMIGGGALTLYPTKSPPINGTSHRIKKLPLLFSFGLEREVSIICYVIIL